MEILLSQRYHYAQIRVYKDYTKLEDKHKIQRMLHSNDDIFYIKETGTKLPLRSKNKKNVYYFTNGTDDQDDKFFLQCGPNDFYTTKDRHIKRHFGRPFSAVSIKIFERTIVKRDDKITIKIYKSSKTRNVNCKHFKKSYNVYSLTINLKTGNFTVTKISKSGKTKTTLFRTNIFTHHLQDVIDNVINTTFHVNSNYESLNVEMNKAFDQDVFYNEFIKVFPTSSVKITKPRTYNFLSELINHFVIKKEIKVPNGDFRFLIKNFYPTEKYLKKNDRKLIASVLDLLGIKSKITIKILHDVPNIDLIGLRTICKIFGNDYPKYIGLIDENIIKNSFIKDKNVYTKNQILPSFPNELEYSLTKEEKYNLLKIINSTQEGFTTCLSMEVANDIRDHFDMIKKLREYDPNIKMRAKNGLEFREEHRELTKLVSAIKKGWVIQYVFDEKTLNDIEQKIDSHYFVDEQNDIADRIFIYPHILKREEEYIEEGNFMHHCVATYADKDKSIIISLRTEDQMDRVTCEFDIQTGECIQSRHFCNGQPPLKFEEAIFELRKKVKRNAKYGTLNWKEKIMVPITINGIEVKPEGPRRPDDINLLPIPF